MNRKADKLIFTDLDGTLLDHETYSWKKAEPALRLAKRMDVPVIFCTSKTRAEIEVCRRKIGNREPFIAENGEAIFIPKGYFSRRPAQAKTVGKYHVIVLGRPYRELREVISKMQKKGLRIKGFGDMTPREVTKLTGLSAREARLAMKREYDEPFILGDRKHEAGVREFARKNGLRIIKGGRFYHLLGSSGGKGIAAGILSSLYGIEAGKPPVTAGLGDSQNDFPLLRMVSVPYLLKAHDGRHASNSSAFIRHKGKGPDGWNSAVIKFLEEF
jgi:mannosyl-3-phosphoglycerate phosphatase